MRSHSNLEIEKYLVLTQLETKHFVALIEGLEKKYIEELSLLE